MTLNYRNQREHQEEIVSAKQRELLAKRKAELVGQIDNTLNQIPDSEAKQELLKKRDHCVAKFPVFPVDLSIWVVAYFEDFYRDYHRAVAAGETMLSSNDTR